MYKNVMFRKDAETANLPSRLLKNQWEGVDTLVGWDNFL